MYQHTRLTTNRFTFFQKFRNFDYVLLFCILLLGIISLATMYSTDGGEVLFHTRSHTHKQCSLLDTAFNYTVDFGPPLKCLYFRPMCSRFS